MTFSYLNSRIQDFIIENKIPTRHVIENCHLIIRPELTPHTVFKQTLQLAQVAQEQNKNIYSVFLDQKLLCFVALNEDEVIKTLSTSWNECGVLVFED